MVVSYDGLFDFKMLQIHVHE